MLLKTPRQIDLQRFRIPPTLNSALAVLGILRSGPSGFYIAYIVAPSNLKYVTVSAKTYHSSYFSHTAILVPSCSSRISLCTDIRLWCTRNRTRDLCLKLSARSTREAVQASMATVDSDDPDLQPPTIDQSMAAVDSEDSDFQPEHKCKSKPARSQSVVAGIPPMVL